MQWFAHCIKSNEGPHQHQCKCFIHDALVGVVFVADAIFGVVANIMLHSNVQSPADVCEQYICRRCCSRVLVLVPILVVV